MNSLPILLRARPQHSKLHKYLLQHKSFSNEVKEEIVIPRRIPRGSTDILRALASTLQRDPTAAHYKYHDDPYLIPMSNIGKRTFAMAQEAGRKAAHWVRKEHADLFQHQEMDPPIKLFFPKMVYTEKSDVKEEDLISVIKDVQVSSAITVYKALKEKGVNIMPTTQQSLLELVCYYNHNDTLSEEFIEERWFKSSTKGKDKLRKTWKDGDLAEEIFITIETPTAETYSAIIQGMVKYYQVERALELFEEAQGKGLVLSTDTYNSLISVSCFIKENYDMRWNFITDMLSSMSTAQLKPNLGTLNAVLEAMSTMGSSRAIKENVLKIISEFKVQGIEPSLATWYYVLITFCKERGPVSGVLYDVMNHLENKEFKIRDLKDTYFFVTAMDICHYHLHDKDLAHRVNKLLNFGENYNLIGDSYKESIYYRHYIMLLVSTQPIEDFMENVYNKFVPHIYVPEPSVMGEILKSVEASARIDYIPKLWSDMIIFNQTDRENLISAVLHTMVTNEDFSNPELNVQFSKVAWDIYNKIENQHQHKIHKISFTGEWLGNIMTCVLRNGDFEKGSLIMEKLDQEQHKILGVPNPEALSLFIDSCIHEKLPSKAISCIQYCADSGFPETCDFAARLNNALTLDENHLNKLSHMVGPDVLVKNVEDMKISNS